MVGHTTWNASAGSPPWAAGSRSGSIDVEELDDRARPAVGQHERQRVGVRRRGVQHLDPEPVGRADVGHEAQLLEAVQLGLDPPPVVARRPSARTAPGRTPAGCPATSRRPSPRSGQRVRRRRSRRSSRSACGDGDRRAGRARSWPASLAARRPSVRARTARRLGARIARVRPAGTSRPAPRRSASRASLGLGGQQVGDRRHDPLRVGVERAVLQLDRARRRGRGPRAGRRR